MDIDDWMNFINKDNDNKQKTKKKKKKNNQLEKEVEPEDQKVKDNQIDQESINIQENPKEEKENQIISSTGTANIDDQVNSNTIAQPKEEVESKKKKKKKNKNAESITPIDNNSPVIKENKYRSFITPSPEITITNTRFQDNSVLRLIGNWWETPWSQTTPPTKSIDDQYDNIPLSKDYPVGVIMDYNSKGIWRSTSAEKKQLESDYEFKILSMRKAAECHKQIRKYGQTIIRPGIKMIDLCKKLETMLKFITNATGTDCGQAFPTGCSLNNVSAHYTPNTGDETVLQYDDVCKIDFGTHFNGYWIDSAFTVAFNPKYDTLLTASKEATNTGVKLAGIDMRLGEIGTAIEEVITSYEIEWNGKVHQIRPIKDWCGHTTDKYKVHGGKSVPIVKSDDMTKMEEGEWYAIETFASTGKGWSREWKDWSHFMKDPYAFDNIKIRSEQPRALFKFINKHFTTLAFCPRWIEDLGFSNYKKPWKYLIEEGLVNPYPPLADIEGSYVSQFEHSFMWRPTCKEVFSIGDDY